MGDFREILEQDCMKAAIQIIHLPCPVTFLHLRSVKNVGCGGLFGEAGVDCVYEKQGVGDEVALP